MPTSNLAAEYLETGQASKEPDINAFMRLVDAAVAGRLSKSVAGSSNVTLTTVEARNAVMEFTGLLTGNVNVELPSAAGTGRVRRVTVFNNTTGAFALTFRYQGGTGVTVVQGYAQELWHSGANVYPAAPPVLIGGTLNTSLVSAWKLDEASGTRYDATGTGNHLTDNNTVTQAAGKLGNAAQFTATNSEYLSIADNADLSVGDIDFTFAAWVYLDTKTGVRDLITKWGASGQFEYLLLYNNSTDRFEWYVSSNGSLTATATASTFGSPSASTWYFVVVYHDSVNNLIGISVNNGAFNAVAHTTGVFNSTSPFHLGGRSVAPAYHNGRLDGVNFWKRVLTPAEVADLYNSGAGRAYPF